jgi:MFS family permease
MFSSIVIGRLIARTGRYKRWMMLGTLLLTAGLGLMGTLDETTSLVELGIFMLAVGAGIGMVMQNLVLVVQNCVGFSEMGAGSALIAFFRSLAGAAGVAALGAVLSSQVTSSIASGLARLGIDGGALASGGGKLPDPSKLPGPVRAVVEHGYGTGVGEIFLVAAPLGLIAFAAIALIREVPLGTLSGVEAARRDAERGGGAGEPALAR